LGNGRGAVGVVEVHAFRGQAVEVRGLHVRRRLFEKTHIGVADIVDHDHEYVRLLGEGGDKKEDEKK